MRRDKLVRHEEFPRDILETMVHDIWSHKINKLTKLINYLIRFNCLCCIRSAYCQTTELVTREYLNFDNNLFRELFHLLRGFRRFELSESFVGDEP